MCIRDRGLNVPAFIWRRLAAARGNQLALEGGKKSRRKSRKKTKKRVHKKQRKSRKKTGHRSRKAGSKLNNKRRFWADGICAEDAHLPSPDIEREHAGYWPSLLPI